MATKKTPVNSAALEKLKAIRPTAKAAVAEKPKAPTKAETEQRLKAANEEVQLLRNRNTTLEQRSAEYAEKTAALLKTMDAEKLEHAATKLLVGEEKGNVERLLSQRNGLEESNRNLSKQLADKEVELNKLKHQYLDTDEQRTLLEARTVNQAGKLAVLDAKLLKIPGWVRAIFGA